MTAWQQLEATCYQSHASTPLFFITIGMITSLFINCYFFFAGQTLTTRLFMYLKQMFCCCYCCCNTSDMQLQQLSDSSPISSYPAIIQISSTNTKDIKILDICGYYRRALQITDKDYIYYSTFRSYTDKSMLILHYSFPPKITFTKSNTISFTINSKMSKKSSMNQFGQDEQEWIITHLKSKNIAVNSQSSLRNQRYKVHGKSETTTYGSSGIEFLYKNCCVVAIQNKGNKNQSASLDNITDYINKQQSVSFESPLESLLKRPNQLWIFDGQRDVDTEYKYILNISSGTVKYYVTNFIAVFMVILALYQIYIDFSHFLEYVINKNHDKDIGLRHFYNYQCFGMIIINSPSFKQMFVIFACLIIGKSNAVIYIKHLNLFRKLLGVIYILYAVLYLPIFITHTLPFLLLYLTPLIIIILCAIWRFMKLNRMQTGLLGFDGNESIKDEMIFLMLGFLLIFMIYIVSILSISTMVRFYDGETYIDSFSDALWERKPNQYFKQKFNSLEEIDETIEMLYRII